MSIQLSISLLMSDRPETAGKCLASLKPLLKELDSELIVVFTGKNNDILDLIRQYTSHIIPFTWCNDFSKARNAGLEEAKGEWFLFLDDDEWFENTEEIIRFFKNGEYRQYQSALYIQRNYSDWDGQCYADSDVGRMCRLTPDTKFVYPIHENLNPFPEPYKYLRSYVHHYGYVEKSDSASGKRKSQRNLSLLLENYKKAPSAQYCMQITQEYTTVKEYDTAAAYCREGLKLAAKEGRIVESYELWMQAHLPFLISSAGEPKAAIREGDALLSSPRTLEVGKAYIYNTLVDLCQQLRDFQKGIDYVRKYHQTMEYLRKHPEKASRQKCLSITFSDVEGRSAKTYIAGLCFAAKMGNLDLVKELLAWIPWDDTAQVQSCYSELEEWKQNHEDLLDMILEGFSQLKTENAYVCLQKSLFAVKTGQYFDAERYWKACAVQCPSELQPHLAEAAVMHGFSLKPLLETVSLEAWTECADGLAERIAVPDMPAFYQKILPELEEFPLCAERLNQRFLEKQLHHGLLDLSKLTELLGTYCGSILTEARALYRDELLRNPDSYALPPLYKFAFLIQDVLGLIETGKLAECIPLLKKAVRVYPRMSSLIGRLTKLIDEQANRPQATVSEEFAALGLQVKQVLYGLIENRQWGEAYSVVAQLASLLPDDLEVLRLKQEILFEM